MADLNTSPAWTSALRWNKKGAKRSGSPARNMRFKLQRAAKPIPNLIETTPFQEITPDTCPDYLRLPTP